ncbi:MAG: hypothetical protein ABEJ87_05470 [Candidatus Nanohalobium sp.]
MKGQSAIEYLMSYGWMLLVVAIIGGAIYTTVGGRCVTSTSGFSSTDVRVADFGTTGSGELRFNLRNAHPEPIEITNISVTSETSGQTVSSGDLTRIPALGTSTAPVSDVYFQEANGCNVIQVQITYDSGGIENQIVTGQFTSKIKMGASALPSQPTSLSLSS